MVNDTGSHGCVAKKDKNLTDTTIVDSGGNAANPRTDNIVDVPSYKPEAETPEAKTQAANRTEGQSTEETAEAKEAKKRNGYKEKLEREKARAADLEAKLAEATKKPTTEAADKEPKHEDFETWDAYYKADAKYQARQEFARLEKDRETKARETAHRNEFADKQKQYAERADEFKATTPDFDDVIDSYDGPLTAPMQQALLDSDIGPQVAYYLAQNPEEAEALSKMGVMALGKAVGHIEAKLKEPTVDTLPKPTTKTTKAPPPITPVGKSSTNSSYDAYSSKGKDDHDEYMKWRAKNR